MLEALRKLTAVAGVSGCEKEIRQVITDLCAPYADEISSDVLGNLVIRKRGDGPRLMASAHMDTTGLIATYIEKDGWIRFGAVGGLSVESLPHARVRFSNGDAGIIAADDIELKDIKVSDLYIDVGAECREQVRVRPGDTAVFTGGPQEIGDNLVCPYIDDRIGCLVLIEALKKINSPSFDLYFTFTVQEEVGIRGAKTAAYGIEPEYAIAVDVAGTGDIPKSTLKSDTKLGGGAMIRMLDRSALSHREFTEFITETAQAHGLPYQLDATQKGGSDAGEIHKSKSGVRTGFICVPARYIHSPAEMANKKDVQSCIDLLAAVCCKKISWEKNKNTYGI